MESKGSSAKELFVAEAEGASAVEPAILEGAEAEPEITVRVADHERHPVAADGVQETFLFIERSVPLIFRQLVSLLFENEGRALGAGEDGLLTAEEIHPLLRSGRADDDRLECANAKPVAGLQDPAWVREVGVGDIVIEIVELFKIPLQERGEPSRLIVVIRHRDDAEIHEQSEPPRLLRGFGGQVGFGRSCVDDGTHRFVLSFFQTTGTELTLGVASVLYLPL